MRPLLVVLLVAFSSPRMCVSEPHPSDAWRHDANGDGKIGVHDLLCFLSLWGTEGIPTPTPCICSTPTPTFDVITIPLPDLPADARPLRLVRIPAGSFLMGSPDSETGRTQFEGPVHEVNIRYNFYMGETEVTQAQWEAVMGANPAGGYGEGCDYPVYKVSWEDCQVFVSEINKMGQGTFRLPSEAEWEYACRAGTTTRFYFGDSLACDVECADCTAGTLDGNRSDYMWYCGNNDPVGSKPVRGKLPNAWGLYDMAGGVWEWCQDYWHDAYSSPPVDGGPWLDLKFPRGFRVFRGGNWGTHASFCRSALRLGFYPDVPDGLDGLRVVWTP